MKSFGWFAVFAAVFAATQFLVALLIGERSLVGAALQGAAGGVGALVVGGIVMAVKNR